MSKKVKKLLEESTIRKMMKFADIEPLAETFLDTVAEEEEFLSEEEPEMDMDDEPAMDMDDEPAVDMDPEPEVDEEMVKRIVAAVADAIAQETGVDVEVEGEEGPEMDMGPEPEAALPEPEMDDEPVEMAEAAEEETVEEAKDEELEEAKDEELEEVEEFDYESVVSEVARRVALRLVKESKK